MAAAAPLPPHHDDDDYQPQSNGECNESISVLANVMKLVYFSRRPVHHRRTMTNVVDDNDDYMATTIVDDGNELY